MTDEEMFVVAAMAHSPPWRSKNSVITMWPRSKVASTTGCEEWLAPFRIDPLAAVEDLNRRNFGTDADPALVENVLARAKSLDPERTLGLLKSKFQHDPDVAETLARIDAPVFAINPDFKPIDEESFRRHGVELRVIGGVGHFLMMEAPNALNIELRALFDGPLRSRA